MTHMLSQIPTRVLEVSEVERFNEMIISSLAILNSVAARADLPGSSSADRAFAKRMEPAITACVTEANRLLEDVGGISGFVSMVPLARTGRSPIVVSELNLAAISILVECAIQVQEAMQRNQLADIGFGFGVPTLLTLVASAFA